MKLHSLIDVITNSSSSVYVWPKRDAEKNIKQFFSDFLEKLQLPTTALANLKFENTLEEARIRENEFENFVNILGWYQDLEEFEEDYPEYSAFLKRYNVDLETVHELDGLEDKYVEYVLAEFDKGLFSGNIAARCGVLKLVFADGSKIDLTRETRKWFDMEELSWYDE